MKNIDMLANAGDEETVRALANEILAHALPDPRYDAVRFGEMRPGVACDTRAEKGTP